MSDEPLDPPAEQPEEPAVPAFPEYSVTVAGLGTVTVIDPQGEPGYRVRLPNGAVTAFPAHSGDPCETNAAADIDYAIANPPPAPVPASVTRRQLLLELNARGITRAAIRSQLVTEASLIEFDEASEFAREHPLVGSLAGALGLTEAQVDELFRAAAAR